MLQRLHDVGFFGEEIVVESDVSTEDYSLHVILLSSAVLCDNCVVSVRFNFLALLSSVCSKQWDAALENRRPSLSET